jgi:hypothetical protein
MSTHPPLRSAFGRVATLLDDPSRLLVVVPEGVRERARLEAERHQARAIVADLDRLSRALGVP